MFLDDQLNRMEIYITWTTTVLCVYWGVSCICIYFMHTKQLFAMGLPQVMWGFFNVGSLFVRPFLSWMHTKCFIKLIIFLTLCLRNFHHGFWFVPYNVWQIKSATFLTLYSWIIAAHIFIEFKCRRWKLTTNMPTIVVRIQKQNIFVGHHLSWFVMFWNYLLCSSINWINS